MMPIVPTSSLHTIPELTPKLDSTLQDLMSSALAEETLVYFAAIPLALCIPFDVDYRPDMHPVGAMAIAERAAAAVKGDFTKMLAYQRGYWFIILTTTLLTLPH